MLDEWGLEKIDEFRALKNDIKVYKTFHFEEIKQTYKIKTDELLNSRLNSRFRL
jgi:hypothetical protein